PQQFFQFASLPRCSQAVHPSCHCRRRRSRPQAALILRRKLSSSATPPQEQTSTTLLTAARRPLCPLPIPGPSPSTPPRRSRFLPLRTATPEARWPLRLTP